MQGPESVVAAKSVIRGLSVGEPLAAVVEESADVEAGSTAGCVERVVEWRDGGSGSGGMWVRWHCKCWGGGASTSGGGSASSALLARIRGTIVSDIVVIGFTFVLLDTAGGWVAADRGRRVNYLDP